MAQASAEQVQTWNRQLRREGNPFRLRLTSQSPYLYLREPFRDPPLIRTTGIHHEEANAARRSFWRGRAGLDSGAGLREARLPRAL